MKEKKLREEKSRESMENFQWKSGFPQNDLYAHSALKKTKRGSLEVVYIFTQFWSRGYKCVIRYIT